MSQPRPGQEYTPDAPEPEPRPCTHHRDSLAGWAHHNPHEDKDERDERAATLARQCCNFPRSTRA